MCIRDRERAELFAEVKSNHHYSERRHLVDRVSEDMLMSSHEAIAAQYQSDWRQLFN